MSYWRQKKEIGYNHVPDRGRWEENVLSFGGGGAGRLCLYENRGLAVLFILSNEDRHIQVDSICIMFWSSGCTYSRTYFFFACDKF